MSFTITMSDESLKVLTSKIEEKLNNGYELVTKVKRVDNNRTWKVAMRKLD